MRIMKKTYFVFMFLFFIVLVSVAQARDPFRSVLPVPIKVQALDTYGDMVNVDPGYQTQEYVEPLNVTVEGVIWDIDDPRVIIDGEIYKTKDKLSTVDARILKIEKNSVTVLYSGTMQVLSPKTSIE